MKKGYLVLQDGQVFEGIRFGAEADTVGELVFTTGMCGYIETLTDPSYAGQIVMQTYPLIGNYGIIREDFEGACCVKGYVVREWCEAPSNFRTDCDLDTFLKEQGVPGLWGVDTRELTRIIREHGVMNGAITTDELTQERKEQLLKEIRAFVIKMGMNPNYMKLLSAIVVTLALCIPVAANKWRTYKEYSEGGNA